MIIHGLLLLTIFTRLGLTATTTQSRERHEPTISECAARGGECDESRGRPVCGTDDQTYPTRCHLLRVQCSGHQVSLKYRGPCKACKEAREYALKHKSRNPPKFIPRCKPDGAYAPIQCLGDTGCWCSDITGKPVENTSVRTGKPKCKEYNNIRRSPARHLSPSRGRRTCTQIDRAAFNSNLIKVFQSEYIRSGQHKFDITAGKEGAGGAGGSTGVFIPPADNLVLDWKFIALDVNFNQLLDKNEFRELKKLVKRAVKPRRCGRTFGKFCDIDNDDRLTRSEWNSCLSKDTINRHPGINDVSSHGGYHSQHMHNNNNNNNNNNNRNTNNRHNTLYVNNHHQHPQTTNTNHQNTIHHSSGTNNNNNNNSDYELNGESSNGDDDESSQHLDYDDDDDVGGGNDYDADDGGDDDDDIAGEDNISMLNTFGSSSTNYPSIYFLRPKPETPLKSESEGGEFDCLADRTAAIEEQRHGGTILYVPECTPDGRYQRVQCYRSTPYCWCVHEDTGKNIPGTSMKDKRPQCDTIYTVTRPMKGCPEPRKTAFLKELKEFLKSQILASTNANGANTTNWNSEDERIATLSFVLLDKNKNKSWERREWKMFRELVTNSKTLRKCGKKMPRYCDVNSDKKITLSEWLNCLQAQHMEIPTTTTTTPKLQNSTDTASATSKPSKLIGSNPLEQYLKD